MHAKTRRLNHDFQIAYFLAGSCHTPDGAYALLCDLRDDRQAAIAAYHVSTKRLEAKRLEAAPNLEHADAPTRLRAQADFEEATIALDSGAALFEAAQAELTFIERCIEKLEPHRKFKDLPDGEAHEAAQREEWRLELIYRAENFIACHGGIPQDQYATMRQHPDFASSIRPAIAALSKGEAGHPAILPRASVVELLELKEGIQS